MGLVGNVAIGAQLTVSWSDNSDNETGFKIERSFDGSSFSEIATAGANVESYVDSGLEPATTYWYRVRAYNSMGNSSYSNVASGTTAAPVNTTPTISNISNQTIVEGTSTGVLSFTVGDAETSVGSLSVSRSSSNTTLVPTSNVVLGGSGANRTVTVTPASGQSGTATITVTVSDGSLSASDTFVLTVNAVEPVNTAPTITAISDQVIDQDTTTGALSFSVGDAESSAFELSTTASSSNTSLVPNANIVFNGIGTNRTVTVTPEGARSGSATITVTVSDGSLATDETFVVTINATSGGAPVPEVSLVNSETTVLEGGDIMISTSLTGDTSNLARVEFYSDGIKIGEATEPPYSFTWADAPIGEHSIVAVSVNNDGSISSSSTFTVTVVASPRLISLSTRGVVDSSNPMIAGFAIKGSGPQRVLVRAVGKGMERLGLSGVVEEPIISVATLGSTDVLVQTADGWDNDGDPDALVEAMAATGAFALQRGSRDAAVLIDLDPGQYTAVISDTSGKGGLCLVEVYLVEETDLPSGPGRLLSLSTRGNVGKGGNALIAGLVVDGATSKRLLIRGIGPGLSRIGVNGVVEDPQISVVPFGEQKEIAANDDWSTDPATAAEIIDASARVHAFSLSEGSSDAVLLVDLDPGIYTVALSPASGKGGTGLIEVYEVAP